MSDVPELLKPLVPSVGSVWLWEPEKPHARQSVVVTAVKWNGEEVWVESRGVDDDKRYWNELGRWIEATVFEGWAEGYEDTISLRTPTSGLASRSTCGPTWTISSKC